jgi:hypothetical protein
MVFVMAANLGYINLKTAVFQPIILRFGPSPLHKPIGRGPDLLLFFEPDELSEVILDVSGPVDH